MPQNLSPYTGKEPFIFISYAHRDDQRVLPVIHKLLAAGFRIWYDDAIEKGREWDNDIARHVRDCAVFIPFFTENYLDSFNCKNELRYALSKKRRCLAVFLEEISFEDDPGLEMYIYVNQNIMAQSMKTDTIFEKIAEVPLLQPCLIQLAPDPAPEPQTEPVSVPASQPEKPREMPPEPVQKAPAPAVQTAAPKFGPIRWILWVLLLLGTLLLVILETLSHGYDDLLTTTGERAALVILHLLAGLAGVAAIAVTEAKHPVRREKNSPGLILRGSVTCLNLMLAVMLLTYSSSAIWQILAGGLAAAGFFIGGLRIRRLRQFDGKSGMMCFYAAAWLIACNAMYGLFDEYGHSMRMYLCAGVLAAAALAGFLVLTLILAVKGFRQKEPRRGRYIVQFAVLGMMLLITLLILSGFYMWFTKLR